MRSEIAFLERAVALAGEDATAGAALLPDLLSALLEAGEAERAETLAGRAVAVSASLGLDHVGARAAIERERIALSRHPETFDARASMVVATRAAATLRRSSDQLDWRGRRSSCPTSSGCWGIPSPRSPMPRRCSPSPARGQRLRGRHRSPVHVLVPRRGPWPVEEALARRDALARATAGHPTAELVLLACRATLMAVDGRYDDARADMALARAGVGELGLELMNAYLALFDSLAETLAGRPEAAERTLREAAAVIAGSGDRWHQAMVNVELAHAVIAQGRDASAEVARIEAVPAYCDVEWVVKRHTARAWSAARAGDRDGALREARAGVAAAQGCGLRSRCRAGAAAMLRSCRSIVGSWTTHDIQARIEALEAEEQRLRGEEEGAAPEVLERDRKRLAEIKVELDQLWDLLRQRRALRDAGRDPDAGHHARPEDRRGLPELARYGPRIAL